MSSSGKRFRIALSFAGEKRAFVEEVARVLAKCFSEEEILYDEFHEAEFARHDLGIQLPKLYGEQSELIVPVLCPNYDPKRWTGWEWLHIYSLLTKADGHRVMPCRFQHAIADGLSAAAGFIELDHKTPMETAALILQRLAINEGKPKDYYTDTVPAQLPRRRSWIKAAAAMVGLVILSLVVYFLRPGRSIPDLITEEQQLTYAKDGRRSADARFSPDGRFLVFGSERDAKNPFYQVYLLEVKTMIPTRISGGVGKATGGFFQPQTSRILFASTHLDPEAAAKQARELKARANGERQGWDFDATFDLFSCKSDGSDFQRLTDTPGYDAEGAYSPDGTKIAFCSVRSAYPLEKLDLNARNKALKDPLYYAEIYTMNSDGTGVRRLTTRVGYDSDPCFSPDGERIAWTGYSTDESIAEIWTMKKDGSDQQQVTHLGVRSWMPCYHPSGKYIAFTSRNTSRNTVDLFVVDPSGKKEPVQVTFRDGFNGAPAFSPDGKWLVWTSARKNELLFQIFQARWNHDAAQKAVKAAPVRASH
jgi:Tol biopolymer transport system component